ncbi:MAG TPA: hypothetical protein VM716_12280 [Gemmatimonadales bacterium]|nr:hypothetical protein [Gemmatimonadales bacterium]
MGGLNRPALRHGAALQTILGLFGLVAVVYVVILGIRALTR